MFNITKTKDEIIKDKLSYIDSLSDSALRDFIMSTNSIYSSFWNDTDITPQEFCDALGSSAYLLFQKSAQAQAFIKSQLPEYTPLGVPEGKNVAVNSDGTVTITDTTNG